MMAPAAIATTMNGANPYRRAAFRHPLLAIMPDPATQQTEDGTVTRSRSLGRREPAR